MLSPNDIKYLNAYNGNLYKTVESYFTEEYEQGK